MSDSVLAHPGASGEDAGASPWDSQHHEFDYPAKVVEGRIPDGLRGLLYRIGPGRLDVDGHPMSHIFDGDGMVSRLAIDPEGVHYRNRYVRTASRERTNRTRRPAKGFGTQRLGGPLVNILRFPENLSNTNVLLHEDALYSLWEGGRPHALDPTSLDTLCRESFDGALKRLGAFSAHPRRTPPRARCSTSASTSSPARCSAAIASTGVRSSTASPPSPCPSWGSSTISL